MIERVVLDGVDVDLSDVFASVTIRHGRGSADDGPLASTCSLALVNVTRAMVSAFSVADELEILLGGDVPRFRGRVTDADLTTDGLSLIAVSSLSWLSGRKIGLDDWPEELWSARVLRAFGEAGYVLSWSSYGATTWDELDPATTWAAPIPEPLVTVQVGPVDPLVAARPAGVITLGQYLASLAETEPAAIANLPNGNVLVQALSYRRAIATIELDPLAVAFAPEWAMLDDVENSVTVSAEDGDVLAEDLDSIERFEARPVTIETELATLAAASDRAELRLVRRAYPKWHVDSVELLELDATIGVGTPLVISELPAWAPADSYLGMVEGWEDHVEPDGDGGLEWTAKLLLSDPRLSGFGLLWSGVPAVETWADAGAATWTDPELILTT